MTEGRATGLLHSGQSHPTGHGLPGPGERHGWRVRLRRFGAARTAARSAGLGLALWLAACATPPTAREAPPPTPRLDPVAAAARLPSSAAGFERRGLTQALPRGEEGLEVAYATPGRVAAAAVIQVLQPPGGPVPDGVEAPAVAAALDAMLREALQQGSPHRRLRETGRFLLPGGAAAQLRCLGLEGSYGRDPVEGIACAGAANGLVLRLRATMPRRTPPVADSRAFASEILASLRR